jgi:pimeloyl-ACP methyl ester carboxylesterase
MRLAPPRTGAHPAAGAAPRPVCPAGAGAGPIGRLTSQQPARPAERSSTFQLVPLTARKLAVSLLAAPLFLACALPARAGAQLSFSPCNGSVEYACAHLTVPLDPSGATPGAITLAIRRHRAPVGEARTAVIALAGGPGQAALPFMEDFTEILGPALATRDLIVFDQRGTGYSHPLSCHGFETPGAYHTAGQLLAACAEQIGPERAFYTTADTVADIEAIRAAGGYEKLVLWGTSYGTKVAEEYAQRYPQYVEALVLDSVVPPTGPDPLDRSTFAAVPRILRQLCVRGQCAGITRNPVADLARLVRRMGAGGLSGRWIGPHGHPDTLRVTSNELLNILLAGDFNPTLRAEFPAAVHAAAAAGDTAPLARLLVRAEGGEAEGEAEAIDVPLYLTTTCEEIDFPWSRAASPAERLAQARATIGALPASSYAPFTATDVLDFDELPTCAHWPFATPAPPAVSEAMPNVPTLILSGADDLRTPTANAQAVAAQIPDAHLLVVPYTGHAVLEDEPTHCAREAVRALLAGRAVRSSCPAAPPPPVELPTPLPPERLAALAPAPGNHGRAGRTVTAVQLTLAYFEHQADLRLLEAGGESGGALASLLAPTGGLRAGWAQLTLHGTSFHGYSYVPGVTLTGVLAAHHVLRVGGRAGAHGTLRLAANGSIAGTLGGHRVHVAATPTARAAIVGTDAQASDVPGPRGSATRARARRLAGALGGIPEL